MRMLEFTHDSMTSVNDGFDFPIVNFPYITNNIPESTAYGVFVS